MKIILLLLSFALFSCQTTSKISNSAEYKHIVKTERIIDTIRVLERDTTVFKALLKCDSLGQVHIASLTARDSEISTLKSSLKNNVLDIEVEMQTIERIKELIRIDTVYVEKMVEQYEKVVVPISWWRNILMWLGVIFLVLQILKLIRIILIGRYNL